MDESANMNPGVRVVKLGLGKVVSNWGTHNGVPCVFLEPVLGDAMRVGQEVEDGQEPQITLDGISDGGVVIEIHSEYGLKIVMEDAWRAVHAFTEAHPEKPKCGDCVLIHGKSVCTMNCGPTIAKAEATHHD